MLRILGILGIIYLLCAVVIFIVLSTDDDIMVKYTNKSTGEVVYLKGIKKFIVCLFLSIFWIFTIKRN